MSRLVATRCRGIGARLRTHCRPSGQAQARGRGFPGAPLHAERAANIKLRHWRLLHERPQTLPHHGCRRPGRAVCRFPAAADRGPQARRRGL